MRRAEQPVLHVTRPIGQRSLDGRQFSVHVLLAELLKHRPSFRQPAALHQAPRAFGNAENQEEENRRRKCQQPEHPPPCHVGIEMLGDVIIRDVGQHDPDHDIELIHHHQPPAQPRRRNLGNVHRRDHRHAADGQPAEEPGEKKLPPVPRQAASQGRDEKEYGQQEQRFLRPQTSDGLPMANDPMSVPSMANATVTPSQSSFRWKTSCSALFAPEMTAVSKPKIKPPSAAMIAPRMSTPCRKEVGWLPTCLAMLFVQCGMRRLVGGERAAECACPKTTPCFVVQPSRLPRQAGRLHQELFSDRH